VYALQEELLASFKSRPIVPLLVRVILALMTYGRTYIKRCFTYSLAYLLTYVNQ